MQDTLERLLDILVLASQTLLESLIQGNQIQIIIFLLIISILISSCSTNEISEEPAVVDEMIVTFKPENCEYVGPTVIQHGEIKVIFDNQTDKYVIYDIFLLQDGKSWQDIVDNFAGGTRNVGMPNWAILQRGKVNIG